jgi:hypothetical protein
MERFVVGFTTVTLLLSGVGHGRTDSLSANQFGNPDREQFLHFGSPDRGRFLNPPGAAVDLPWNVLVADPLNLSVRMFTGNGSPLINFTSVGSGDRQFFELTGLAWAPSGNSMAGTPLNARTRELPTADPLLTTSNGFGIETAQFYDAFGMDVTQSRDSSVADTFIDRSELSSADDPFLAKFGGFANGQAQLSPPARVAVDLSGSGSVAGMLLNHKWVLSLILLGCGVLGTLAFAWRQRRAALQRTLRGPRRAALYRSSSLPNPRGTRR